MPNADGLMLCSVGSDHDTDDGLFCDVCDEAFCRDHGFVSLPTTTELNGRRLNVITTVCENCIEDGMALLLRTKGVA